MPPEQDFLGIEWLNPVVRGRPVWSRARALGLVRLVKMRRLPQNADDVYEF